MKKMPSRDTTGKCKGECRDRAFEAREYLQHEIEMSGPEYSTPAPTSPSWTLQRNEPPGIFGGRM